MPEFNVNRQDIPLWDGANGDLVLRGDVNPNAPLAPGAAPIVDASFRVDGNQNIAFGHSGALRIGIEAGARARIVPVFLENPGQGQALVDRFQLAPLLKSDNVLLALDLGADASLSADGSFRYTVLSATANLKSGADASYFAARTFPRSMTLLPMIRGLLAGLSMPASLRQPPGEGEVVSFEFGGYLNFGLGAAAGYELKGSKSFRISEIALAEHYALSVIGKLTFTGKIAGRFSVDVSAGSEKGWARVIVRRRRSKELQFAADVNVNASLDTQGLPRSGKEFLGALLGVEGKSWLNRIDGWVDEAGKVDSLPALQAKLDSLAKDFLNTWTGKAIDKLLPAEVKALQARIAKVVDSYRKLDANAIALFDRFFDPVLDRTAELSGALDELRKLTSWDQLQGEINPTLWNVVRQLTGGDPLTWALGRIPGKPIPSLPELQKRIADTTSLIRDTAHQEIRDFLKLAKEQFHLDPLFHQLATISSPAALHSLVNTRLGGFVERLIGDGLGQLNGNDLKRAFEVVKAVSTARAKFFDTFDRVLREAASQTFAINLHAAYNNSDERTAMIDCELCLQNADGSGNPTGLRFMGAAGRGDFQEILANFQPAVVKLREGLLTHRVASGTTLKFNVAGWHRSFSYEAMHRVIVNTEQQIRPSPGGVLNVFTTVDMTAESEQRRNGGTKSEEAVLTNFLLRFLAETKVSDSSFDSASQLYALDVITGMAANYDVSFTDADTSPAELDDYLVFARELGLDTVGATRAGLAPVLEEKNGSFGPVKSSYEVRYTEEGIRRLISLRPKPAQIKNILRRIVLANYYNDPNLSDAGWLYASDDVRALFDRHQNNFVSAETVLGTAAVTLASPIAGIKPPRRFRNTFPIRNNVATLFRIEDTLLEAFDNLGALLASTKKIKTADLEKKLKRFGDALQSFDGFDMGENSVFAVFDGLIQLATPAREARSSALTFVSMKDGAERTKIFTLKSMA
ncbi:MAG: hypothetical protein JNK48_05645 [Bryobacterales bacterium]|nr:hypothetical protein [Bryobacterales bacterium]